MVGAVGELTMVRGATVEAVVVVLLLAVVGVTVASVKGANTYGAVMAVSELAGAATVVTIEVASVVITAVARVKVGSVRVANTYGVALAAA